MQDVKIKLADVKEQIEEKVFHPYLLKHIKAPVIDEDKLLLLISILDEAALPTEKAEKYAVTTMLIQIALDTHELITNDELEPENLKNRQLTVLTGVYYSGLYYKILSALNEITLICTLAEGIKDINEHKISVYQKAPKSTDCLMNSIKKIESALFAKIADFLDEADWKELISNLLFIKRINEEKKKFLQGGTSVVFEVLKELTFPKIEWRTNELSFEQRKYLILICERYTDFSRFLVEKNMKKLSRSNVLLEKKIQQIINQPQPVEETFVEEG